MSKILNPGAALQNFINEYRLYSKYQFNPELYPINNEELVMEECEC